VGGTRQSKVVAVVLLVVVVVVVVDFTEGFCKLQLVSVLPLERTR